MGIGRTRKRKKQRGDGAVPTDSFADIAFLLIVFFILVTTMVKTKGFETQLPSSKDGKENSEKEMPMITMSGEVIRYDDNTITMDNLRKRLDELNLESLEEKNRMIKVKASKDTKYEIYYPVWAAIAKAGGTVVMVKEKKKK